MRVFSHLRPTYVGVGALLDGDYDYHGGGIEVSRRVLRNSELKPAGKTDLSESIEL